LSARERLIASPPSSQSITVFLKLTSIEIHQQRNTGERKRKRAIREGGGGDESRNRTAWRTTNIKKTISFDSPIIEKSAPLNRFRSKMTLCSNLPAIRDRDFVKIKRSFSFVFWFSSVRSIVNQIYPKEEKKGEE
jgi:hypothetical protein